MSVKIERAVTVAVECDCGEFLKAIKLTRNECFADLKRCGWQIAIHRKGEPTVLCPACVDKAEQDKAALKAAEAALRKARDDAIQNCTAELAALKSGEEKET